MGETLTDLGAAEIEALIPHRAPMLMVDSIREMVPGKWGIGIKNTSEADFFFKGHFPGAPVMPGVLTIEALAQTAGVVAASGMGEEAAGKLVYFMAISQVKFRKMITPGDQVELHVEVLQARRRVWKFSGKAIVDGAIAAEAIFTAMIADRPA